MDRRFCPEHLGRRGCVDSEAAGGPVRGGGSFGSVPQPVRVEIPMPCPQGSHGDRWVRSRHGCGPRGWLMRKGTSELSRKAGSSRDVGVGAGGCAQQG